jgi:hypothetical protein
VNFSTINNAGDGFFFASALASTGTALLEEVAMRPYYSQEVLDCYPATPVISLLQHCSWLALPFVGVCSRAALLSISNPSRCGRWAFASWRHACAREQAASFHAGRSSGRALVAF